MQIHFPTILALALIAVLAISATQARSHGPGSSRIHGNPNLNTHRPVRSHVPVKHSMPIEYSPTMAYHEEPTRPPRPLYEAQLDVEDFHTSGNYDAEVTGVINNAILYAQSGTPQNNSVWVFDIDETSLSGYSEMLSLGFGYVPKLSKEWILNASAPAIPQTLGLYQAVLKAGYRVIFLTGRTQDESEATALNMQNAGYTQYDTLITRLPSEQNLTATVYKSNRRTILVENEGYDVVGCVGDQWSDLHGPYTGFKVKIPNYIYFLP